MSDIDDDLSELDTSVDRATIDRIPIDLLDRWLDQIRDRRLALARKVAEAERVRAESLRRDASDKFDRELARVVTLQAKLDQLMVTYETRVNKLRILEVEMSE